MKTPRKFLHVFYSAALLACLVHRSGAQDFFDTFFDVLLPPPTGAYQTDGPAQFENGVVIHDLDLRLPSQSAPPEPTVTIEQYQALLSMGIVLLDGVERKVAANATVTVRLMPLGGDIYDTEMQQFDVQGGSLPPGVLIRESPTRASLGRTTLQSQADGTWRIGSFFDIFTEVSLDGGQNWSPTVSPTRCNLKPIAPENSFVSSSLPPGMASYVGRSAITFANGFIFQKLTLSAFTQSELPPEPGGARVQTTLATLSGEVSSDNGTSFQPFTETASIAVNVRSGAASAATRYFDTDMFAFSFGTSGVMIRESPTTASVGRTSLRSPVAGDFRISSFFDIFTEISTDGGQSWSPAMSGACTLAIPESAPLPEHFFATDCFPAAATYETATDVETDFGNGIVIRNFRHRPGAMRAALPQPGAQETRALGGTVELELSRDDGNTFQHYYVVTFTDCLVSGYSISGNGGHSHPMESLSLNFTLPGGVMVRESPTKASLGRTSVRGVEGGYMIGSFFDIFTEVSLDGGQTWTPADGAMHASLLPYIEQANIFATDFHPPRNGSYATRRYVDPITFPNGTLVRDIRFEDFSKTAPPPATGGRLMEEEGIFYFFMSTDGGRTWTSQSAPAHGQVRVSSVNPGPPSTFATEMLSLDISGGTLPAGVMIRESPTRRSLGRIGQEVIVDFVRMDSFFDVFTELSVDGGQTWLPADKAARLELHAKPAEIFNGSDFAPFVVQYRESDLNFATFTGNAGNAGNAGQAGGIRAVVIDNLSAQQRQPLPSDGQSLTQALTANVSFDLTLDGGQTFTSVNGYGEARFTFRNRMSQVNPNSWTFDTEMLALDLSGGTLPPGVMLRESPTRASLGRTSVREVGGYRIGSFFDVFFEVSTDGGTSWTPMCDPIRIEGMQSTPARVFTSKLLPPDGVLRSPPGGMALACATGVHIKDGRITRSSRGGVLPPAPGASRTVGDKATAEFLLSMDNGQTFKPVRAPAFFRYELENVLVSGLTTTFDTEMLALDISGGRQLPPGVMIRESPTRKSMGKMSVLDNGIHDGAFRIASFFDVFIEISADGGTTWEPCDTYLQLEFENTMISSYSVGGNYPSGGDWVPMDQVSLNFTKIEYADRSSIRGFDVFLPSDGQPLPAAGNSNTFTFDAACRVVLVTDPAAGTTQMCDATAHVDISAAHSLTDGSFTSFDTEMFGLDLAGGTLPPGVMIRESPTRRSTGRLVAEQRPTGTFRIGSFFDIFTEISTDGGQTWSPSDGSVRLMQVPARPPMIVSQPESQRVLPGTDVDFTVEATGTPPLSYQWFFNGKAIEGETDALLPLDAVKPEQSGFYSVRVSGPGGTVVSVGAELLVVRNVFQLAVGNYAGLLAPASAADASFENTGCLKLKLSRNGSFTGTVMFGGATTLLRGAFGLDGEFSAVITRKGLPNLTVDLAIDLDGVLDLTNPAVELTGQVSDGTNTASLLAQRVRFLDPTNPALHAGNYTVIMPRVSDLTRAQGIGYAAMRVSKSGAVTIVGAFGFGLPCSFGGFMADDGTLPFYVSAGPSDSVGGMLTFRDLPAQSDCDGTPTWYHTGPAGGGFAQVMDFIGSGYIAPPRGMRVLHFANGADNGSVLLDEGGLPAPIEKLVTVTPNNAAIVSAPGADKLALSIVLKTGLFSGSFIHPTSQKKTPLNGAVLQKQDIGGGLFMSAGQAGCVEFNPR